MAGPYRFEVLDGVDHWIPENVADATNRILTDFLTSLRCRRLWTRLSP